MRGARGVDAWVCLGDIVGYGANPQACLHAVQELSDEVVLGNHDAAAIGQTDLANFNPHARRAAEWTTEQLGESERRYLASLPFVLQRDDAFFVHAEPHQSSRWGYVRCPYDITTTKYKIITAGLPPAVAERLALGH